mmetsp:Transcript_19577/g.48813  ORF Transcript_19577/g.48813 Transcript_19577/m.48813 type:complete len:115 (-) Transcript_19577:1414-1758(-)
MDDAQAVQWDHEAAHQGDADSQCNLGLCFENGRGVGKDEKRRCSGITRQLNSGMRLLRAISAGAMKKVMVWTRTIGGQCSGIARRLNKAMRELNAILVCATRKAVVWRRTREKP